MKKKSNCYLYVVCHDDAGPVKIGITSNVDSRLSSLQTGSPLPLRLVYKFTLPNRDDAIWMEGIVHECLKDHRLSGEWFNLPAMKALHDVILAMHVAIELRFEEAPKYVLEGVKVGCGLPDLGDENLFKFFAGLIENRPSAL